MKEEGKFLRKKLKNRCNHKGFKFDPPPKNAIRSSFFDLINGKALYPTTFNCYQDLRLKRGLMGVYTIEGKETLIRLSGSFFWAILNRF